MMAIKTAGVSDSVTISYLGRKTFTETFAHLFDADELNDYLDHTFNIPKLEKSLLKSRNMYGILYHSDNPIGYFKLKKGLDHNNAANEASIQLQKIYLLRDFLDLKLGKAMLEYILQVQEVRYCKTIWLVVLSTNSRAVQFYLHNGFKKMNNHYYHIGSHQLEFDLMIKDFSR
jgi:diamine N-acetyltransferase